MIFVQWYDFCLPESVRWCLRICSEDVGVSDHRSSEVFKWARCTNWILRNNPTLFSAERDHFKRVYIRFNTFLPFGTRSCAMGRGHVVSQHADFASAVFAVGSIRTLGSALSVLAPALVGWEHSERGPLQGPHFTWALIPGDRLGSYRHHS